MIPNNIMTEDNFLEQGLEEQRNSSISTNEDIQNWNWISLWKSMEGNEIPINVSSISILIFLILIGLLLNIGFVILLLKYVIHLREKKALAIRTLASVSKSNLIMMKGNTNTGTGNGATKAKDDNDNGSKSTKTTGAGISSSSSRSRNNCNDTFLEICIEEGKAKEKIKGRFVPISSICSFTTFIPSKRTGSYNFNQNNTSSSTDPVS